MKVLCLDSDLIKIHVNGQHTFFLNQKIISRYSGKLKKLINKEQKRTHCSNSTIEIKDFPCGAEGFELISRFCYNNGRIHMTPLNVSVLHCSAIFLEMTERVSVCNIIQQTELFLDGLFYWSRTDVLLSLKSCEMFFSSADSSGLLNKLISSLLSRIFQNSDFMSSSSTSSPETISGFRYSSSTKTAPEYRKKPSPSTKDWWFDDLTILPPKIIEKLIKTMGCYGTENNSLILTRFLLHYLKTAVHRHRERRITWPGLKYGGLADTAVHGVVFVGKNAFSCRGLFWVLRIVSGLGLSLECRDDLERLIGGVLEQATLDDLLVSGPDGVGVYDVNLVLRLVGVFVSTCEEGVSGPQRMKKVGRLVDKYLGEISPDHNLKVSKFLAVAESLPDCARKCFDGVYRAIDIYIESHQTLSFEKRSKLCQCLNYEKLTLEACKDLAKNPRIPPRMRIAVQALVYQKPKAESSWSLSERSSPVLEIEADKSPEYSDNSEEMKLNLQRMQWRVIELEKVCKNMKSRMSKMQVNNKVMSSPVRTMLICWSLLNLCFSYCEDRIIGQVENLTVHENSEITFQD